MRVSILIAGAVVLLVVMAESPSAAAIPQDTVGVVDQTTGIWYLRDASNGDTTSFYYGNPGDYPMVGDWDCSGTDTPGLYRQSDGYVYLRNSNTQGVADIKFFFGNPGDIPLAGDFNGDGCDTVSIYRPSESRIYIINELGENNGGLGAAEFDFLFGNPGDKPFIGDFNNNGQDTVALHRKSTGFVYYRNTLTTGIADNGFFYGDPGDQIVAGRWAQDPTPSWDTVGIFRPSAGRFFLRYSNTQGIADEVFQYGNQNMLPVSGHFGALPGGSAPPPPVTGPYAPPPAPRDFRLSATASAGSSCFNGSYFSCHVAAHVRYDGPSTDMVVFSWTQPGQPLPIDPGSGLPRTNYGVTEPTSEVTADLGIPVNTEMCYWASSVRTYRDTSGNAPAVASPLVGPICAAVDTNNELIDLESVPKPPPPTSIEFSRAAAPTASGPSDVWFNVGLPSGLGDAYLCFRIYTAPAANPEPINWLPPPGSCTDVSGWPSGTYEFESEGTVSWRSSWQAYITVPGADSDRTVAVWGTPTADGGWIPG